MKRQIWPSRRFRYDPLVPPFLSFYDLSQAARGEDINFPHEAKLHL